MPWPVPPLLPFVARGAAAGLLAAALAACGPPAPQADQWGLAADAERGRQLLSQYQCGSCHAIPDVAGARGQVGPRLAGFGGRSYIAGHVPNNVEALARWIVEPAALAPGTAMPSMGVSVADARDMAVYLHSVK
jgi:cytochrome c